MVVKFFKIWGAGSVRCGVVWRGVVWCDVVWCGGVAERNQNA